MPKRKATVSKLSGLIDSDGEDEMQMSGEDMPAAVIEEGPPAKKARGRPKATAQTKPPATKPARRKPRTTVTAPTRRAAPKKKAAAKQVVAETQFEEPDAGEPSEVDDTQDNQHEREERANASADELDSPQTVPTRQSELSPAKTRGGRAKTAPAKKVTADGGFEYTPTGTRHIKPEENQKVEGTTRRTGARGRKARVKTPEIHEAPPEDDEHISEVDETTFPHDELEAEQEIPQSPSPTKTRANGYPASKAQTNRRQKGGGTSENDVGGSDSALRRKLGDMTKKFENIDFKYRNLREVGIVEANANFEKLRKQCEATTAASDELIASLKKELAAQSAIAQKSRGVQRELTERDSQIKKLQARVDDGASGLAASQNEVKTLQAKLAASRNASVNAENSASSKNPGSAVKAGSGARNGIGGNAETAQAAQVAQLKEDLYSDLTGLIIRDVKKRESDHLYDCIQTGINGTLHFKLAVAQEADNKTATSFEAAEFHYMPLLDPNRDKDLIEVLPDYLTVDITFSRQHSAKFYSRVMDTLTKRRADD